MKKTYKKSGKSNKANKANKNGNAYAQRQKKPDGWNKLTDFEKFVATMTSTL